MKKFLLGIIATAVMLGMYPVFAIEVEDVLDGYQVIYSPSAKTFATGGMAPDRIVLTKKTSEGSGSYSFYSYKCNCQNKATKCKCGCSLSDKKCNCSKKSNTGINEIALNSNYEFIYENRLIGVDNENLNYYEIVYSDGEFKQNKLSLEEVKQIFKDAEIVKISEFKRGKYTVIGNKTEKEILLFNDTDENFHKYNVTPEAANINKYIKGLIQLPQKGNVIFSHIGNEKTKKYTIRVK